MTNKEFQRLWANPISRRHFLQTAVTLTGLVAVQEMPVSAQDKFGFTSNPFTLGVASGDPLPDGFVLWTRLAPDPLNGAPQSTRSFSVRWQVSEDAGFTRIVQQGATVALPQDAHTIHVELRGLRPGRDYWYRFILGNYTSPVGHGKTAPARGSNVSEIKFAFVSCSDYQNGYFAAYRRIAEEQLDFVLHLGDYLYEYGPTSNPINTDTTLRPRAHDLSPSGSTTQLTTLADYRNRHALYKADPSLQAAHAAHTFIVTWDDHETENNYADDIDEIGDGANRSSVSQFLIQRAAAYKAYYEYMPLRRSSIPNGPDLTLYRKLTYGNLAEIFVLDTRQYRTDQPVDLSGPIGQALAASDFRPSLPPNGNPGGTLLGQTQENWLLGNLDASDARWKVIAQQVMFAQFNYGVFVPPAQGGPVIFNVDQWDGYGANRQRLIDFFAARSTENFIVLTGDIHSSWVQDIKTNFANPASATVATEFICTSISAEFPTALIPAVAGAQTTQPWAKYFNGTQRGYVVCTLTPTTYRSDFKYVETVSTQVRNSNAPFVATAARSFIVQNGVPGAVAA